MPKTSKVRSRQFDWMHPDELAMQSEKSIRSLNSEEPFVLNHGVVRSGKTRSNLHKQIAKHFRNKGMQSAIVRATNVDMHASIRNDLREICKYDFDDPRSPITAYGGKNFTSLYLNDGEIRLGGMENPRHVLGTGYSLINISQLEEIDEDQYLFLATRLSETKALKRDGSYYRQIIADANPSDPDWWGYKYETEGRLKIYEYGFKDNPSFFRQNRWSRSGYEYVRDLSARMPEGLMRDRYFHGLRVSAQGAVFTLLPVHFIDELPDLSLYHKYMAIDFGWESPTVCLWIAWNHIINDTIVYREFRTNHEDIISIGNQINQINEYFGENIEDTIIDREKGKRSLLRQHCGIKAKEVEKFPGSRLAYYNNIHSMLSNTAVQRPGGIRFYTGMMYKSNVDQHSYKGAENLIKELRTVKFEDKKIDSIEKESDHGPDALSYWTSFKFTKRKSKAVDYAQVA